MADSLLEKFLSSSACGNRVPPNDWSSIKLGDQGYHAIWTEDTFTLQISIGEETCAMIQRKQARRLAWWILWRWALVEWCGLRRWLYFKWLQRHVAKFNAALREGRDDG